MRRRRETRAAPRSWSIVSVRPGTSRAAGPLAGAEVRIVLIFSPRASGEMADALASGASARKGVGVQVPPRAHQAGRSPSFHESRGPQGPRLSVRPDQFRFRRPGPATPGSSTPPSAPTAGTTSADALALSSVTRRSCRRSSKSSSASTSPASRSASPAGTVATAHHSSATTARSAWSGPVAARPPRTAERDALHRPGLPRPARVRARARWGGQRAGVGRGVAGCRPRNS